MTSVNVCAAVGSFAILLVEPRAAVDDADPTFDSQSERYPFLYETMKAKRPVRASRMIYGTRSRWSNRVVKRSYVPRGAIGLQPGPLELDKWLPRINGTNESTDLFYLSEAAPPLFDMMIYRDDRVFYYRCCQVAAAVFHARASDGEDEDEILNLQLNIIAREEDLTKSWPGSIPNVTTGEDYIPYIFSQGEFALDATAYPFDDFKLIIDNGLRPKTRNSLTPTCVYAGQRIVKMEVSNPFTAASWTKAQELYNDSDVIGQVKFATGTEETDEQIVWVFNGLRADLETPTAKGHDEIPLNLMFDVLCGGTTSSREVVTTNIS